MEKFDLENFPISESAKKMLSYVSDGFYDESYVGKWLFQVMGAEYDKTLEIVEDLPAQFFPETATWGLMYHEIKWGLPVRMNLSHEERRRQIYLKRDYRTPMTPWQMERYLVDATDFEVHVADINDPGEYGFVSSHPNMFKVYFVGEETLDAKRVFEIIDGLKQSHTTYKVQDRINLSIEHLKNAMRLRNVCLHISISHCDEHKVSSMLKLHFKVEVPREKVNISVETKRNVIRYNGQRKYDGTTTYNAMIRKEIIE